MLKTCEFVSPKHPDKICDYLADSIFDAFLVADPASRVAVEVMGGHGFITVSGEVSSKAKIDIEQLVKNIVGQNFTVNIHVRPQSPFIASGVDTGGAGDQGIMIGYAVDETENFMPLEYETARNLCRKIYDKYPFDGKVQVTLATPDVIPDSDRKSSYDVLSVVASFQNTKTPELKKLVQSLIQADEYFINPAGEWTAGGFDADTGLSGRKIVIDNYGPEFSIGGGSFSGKDYTKVDRSGAYMARRIACDLLKKHSAKFVQVKLAYAIGFPQPVMAQALIDGQIHPIKDYNLTPQGIREFLKLDKVKFADTSVWGHFGRGFEWR